MLETCAICFIQNSFRKLYPLQIRFVCCAIFRWKHQWIQQIQNKEKQSTDEFSFEYIRCNQSFRQSIKIKWNLHASSGSVTSEMRRIGLSFTVQCTFFDFIIDENSIFSSHFFFLISQRLKLNFSFFHSFFLVIVNFFCFFPLEKCSILFHSFFQTKFFSFFPCHFILPCTICPKIGSVIVSERCAVSNGKLLEETMLIQFSITTKAKSIPIHRLYMGADVDAINCK